MIPTREVPGPLVFCPFGATVNCKLLHSIELGVGLMSTVLAKPYVALRTSNHSWVLLSHKSIQGQQIHLAVRTHTQTGTLLQHVVLGLKVMRPVF